MFRGQGKKSHPCAPSPLQRIAALHPEAGDAEQRFPFRCVTADVPHRPEKSTRRDRRCTAPVFGGQQAKFSQKGTGTYLTAPPFTPDGIRLKPHQAGAIGQQTPELWRPRMNVTQFFEKDQGHLPLVVLQVFQHISYADAMFSLGVGGTETGSLQKRGILEVHDPIVPGKRISSGEDTVISTF